MAEEDFSLHELGMKSWNMGWKQTGHGRWKKCKTGRLEGGLEALRVMTELTR
jgi:hypothetical protein